MRWVLRGRSLLPNVVDETLPFEPAGHSLTRHLDHDVENYGTTVPAGDALLLLAVPANRDPRHYENLGVYDIHRPDVQHLTFGHGLHHCLGANPALLEPRVALDEVLNRWSERDIDYDNIRNIRLAPTSTVRGWEARPILVR